MMKEDDKITDVVKGIFDFVAAGLKRFMERYPGKDFGETLKLARARGQTEGWVSKRKGKSSDGEAD
jgi:hypothetical protein